jgi:hypothetical protein
MGGITAMAAALTEYRALDTSKRASSPTSVERGFNVATSLFGILIP